MNNYLFPDENGTQAAKKKAPDHPCISSEDRIRIIGDSSCSLEYWITNRGILEFISPSCFSFTGYTREEYLKNSNLLFEIIHPQDQNGFKRRFQECSAEQKAATLTCRVIKKTGDLCWFEITIIPAYDYCNRYVGLRVSCIECSSIKAAREELILNKEQLSAAIRELESFSYSVSHDLRNPLNCINGMAEVLEACYSEHLDNDGKRCVHEIKKSVIKMTAIITNLLHLSRVNHSSLELKEVHLNKIAAQFIKELQYTNPHRKIDICIDENLKAIADESLIRIALENILRNAFKYSGKRDLTKIEFKKKRIDGKDVFYVKDNGIGFDMQQASNLFTPFQRLHPQDQFRGNGVGLSIVERVIKRHGGKVWAESEVDAGATFFFTL